MGITIFTMFNKQYSLFRITVTSGYTSSTVRLVPGMSVEISTPMPTQSPIIMYQDLINKAFITKYGIDVKKLNRINPVLMKSEPLG